MKDSTNGWDLSVSEFEIDEVTRKRPMAKVADSIFASGVPLPPGYLPTAPNISVEDVLISYILPQQFKGANVGVMMVGSFEPADYVAVS